MPYLELRNVTKRFGSVARAGRRDLRARRGRLFSLLGPTAAARPRRCGASPASSRRRRRRPRGRQGHHPPAANRRDVGMVFQSYSLFPNLTSATTSRSGCGSARCPPPKRHARAAELLELVGLSDACRALPARDVRWPAAARRPGPGAGAGAARAAAGRAAVGAGRQGPRHAAGGDPAVQLELGITTIFVTHDQEEALSVADRVAVLRAGGWSSAAPGRGLRPALHALRGRVRRHDEPARVDGRGRRDRSGHVERPAADDRCRARASQRRSGPRPGAPGVGDPRCLRRWRGAGAARSRARSSRASSSGPPPASRSAPPATASCRPTSRAPPPRRSSSDPRWSRASRRIRRG